MIIGHQRDIGGARQELVVSQVETEFQGDVQFILLDIWVCGGSEE